MGFGDGTDGRLIYLAENLASLHASPDLPWLAGRFEFLGEKVLGAALTALAVADEAGAYRASKSAGTRPATARALWEELGLEALGSNDAAAAAFARAEAQGRPVEFEIADVFPGRTPSLAGERVFVAPVTFNRELLGVGMFIAMPSPLTEPIAGILVSHAAVAINQLRQREEARRLHSVDARLWVPDENFLLAELRREMSRAHRYSRELGLAVLRIENEDAIRERFGDFFTDHLLRRMGSQLAATVRDSDVLGAYRGGYAVLHTDTSLEGTKVSAERLRDVVLNMVAQRFPEVTAPTVSLSVSAYPASGETAEDLLAQVDVPISQDIAA